MNIRGSLPLLILKMVSVRPKHGYQIAQEIKQTSQGILDFKEGTLYPTLHDLEHKGYLDAFVVEENGRTRRYYRLTSSGRSAMHEEHKQWVDFVHAVNLTLEKAP
jgi:PadR family transcriptional regulator PadR